MVCVNMTLPLCPNITAKCSAVLPGKKKVEMVIKVFCIFQVPDYQPGKIDFKKRKKYFFAMKIFF